MQELKNKIQAASPSTEAARDMLDASSLTEKLIMETNRLCPIGGGKLITSRDLLTSKLLLVVAARIVMREPWVSHDDTKLSVVTRIAFPCTTIQFDARIFSESHNSTLIYSHDHFPRADVADDDTKRYSAVAETSTNLS